jgi:membrane fusion protein (multidrug efflux system)
MNMRRTLTSVAVSAAVVLIGVFVMLGAMRSSQGSPEPAVADAKLTNVRVQVLAPTVLEDSLSLTGSVVAWEEVMLSAEISGRIESQGVEDGDRVEAGQTLIQIDTESLKARHEQAQAQLKLAEQELGRVDSLSRNGVSSPQELDRVQANRDVAASDLKVSEIALAKSIVQSPIPGIADTTFHEVGEFVDVGAPLVRVVQVDRVKVVVGIPEKELPLFHVGDAVDVIVDALPAQSFTGVVYRIATTAEASTRTFATEIEVANSEVVLRPGMIARVKLVRARYPDAIAIPIYTVISLDDRRIVFVEVEGKAVARPIEVGFYQDNMVHVTGGLQAGDRVIVVGQRDLRDGQAIRVQAELN